jgi:hypothetical protein
VKLFLREKINEKIRNGTTKILTPIQTPEEEEVSRKIRVDNHLNGEISKKLL